MNNLFILLIFVSLSFFGLVQSDLYFGSRNGACYPIKEILDEIENTYDGLSKNNKTSKFSTYTAFNPQQCQSRSSDALHCCLVSVQSEHYWFNFCGRVANDDYDTIKDYIEELKKNRDFGQSDKTFKIDCGANYNKLFSFTILLIFVLFL